jgi:hypothetical protein
MPFFCSFIAKIGVAYLPWIAFGNVYILLAGSP